MYQDVFVQLSENEKDPCTSVRSYLGCAILAQKTAHEDRMKNFNHFWDSITKNKNVHRYNLGKFNKMTIVKSKYVKKL